MNRKEQDAIRDLVIKLSGDATIDGAGTDSGDPLEFTLAEITEGFYFIDNQFYDAIKEAQPERVWTDGKTAVQVALEIVKESKCQNQKP